MTGSSEPEEGIALLVIALAAATLFHGGLLPFTHGNTYDAFIHMFFGDHYRRSWFDPWESRWYTGFLTVSYPPGTHMLIGALSVLMPLRAAFVAIQLLGILLLVVGVYRFALLWVAPRASGYAALALVLSSSVAETVHVFGQLPTIFSLGVFLNGLPYVFRWIVVGGWANLVAAVIFGAATTAAHHVTTLFGAVLFIVPLGLHALRAVVELSPLAPARSSFRRALNGAKRLLAPVARGLVLAAFLVLGMVLTILPYWIWSVSDPITQVPIPHGSRESFFARLDLGFMFFLLPWGMSLPLLPYAFFKGATTRAWPLGASLALCFLLGTGGTTPLPQWILGGAFNILTLDRFTLWGTILAMPFIGLMFEGLLHGRSGELIVAAFGRLVRGFIVAGLFGGFVGVAVFAAILPVLRPMQPEFIDPAPIVRFMESDEHARWRYLTLGFGDQFAYLSAQMTARSVDGNYHSARRLPDLTRFSVERLENAKYMGVPGLGSLRQFILNADAYHLKYVFSNDAFYDPLLHFAGWTRLIRLQNGVVVWERTDVTSLPLVERRRFLPPAQAAMWGLLPPAALSAAALIFFTAAVRRGLLSVRREYRPITVAKSVFGDPSSVRGVVASLVAVLVVAAAYVGITSWQAARAPLPPEAVIAAHFTDLDFRQFERAWARLDPETRAPFEDAMFQWRWNGGLIASYGKLTRIDATAVDTHSDIVDWDVRLDWLTALDIRRQAIRLRTVRREGIWYVVPTHLRAVQTPVRLHRTAGVDWAAPGRRQPRPETDLYRDRLDRPRIAPSEVRLVRHGERLWLVGQVTNADADPAILTLIGELRGTSGETLVRQGADTTGAERLLPGESAGFRIGFEGVLRFADVTPDAGYNPSMYLPPLLAEAPAFATLEARALVSTEGLYRGVSLNAVRAEPTPDGLRLSGLAVNTGIETAGIVRVGVLLYDAEGHVRWADAGYVETNIYPGQSAPFVLDLPAANEIEILSEVAGDAIAVNGAGSAEVADLPGPADGTLPLSGVAGWSAARLSITSMTHDPDF
jgi:hypothetical protein